MSQKKDSGNFIEKWKILMAILRGREENGTETQCCKLLPIPGLVIGHPTEGEFFSITK